MLQIDASHIGIGAVGAGAIYALSETVRYFIKRDKDRKSFCEARRVERQLELYQRDTTQTLKEIRDGINRLVTLSGG